MCSVFPLYKLHINGWYRVTANSELAYGIYTKIYEEKNNRKPKAGKRCSRKEKISKILFKDKPYGKIYMERKIKAYGNYDYFFMNKKMKQSLVEEILAVDGFWERVCFL